MRCGSISSNYSDQCENREIGFGPSGMGNDTKYVVEISHKHATNFGSRIGGVEQAEKAIGDAVLGRIGMVGSGKEGNQFQGINIDSLGNFLTMKLFQILKTVSKCDLLICCREEIQEILNYMTTWKPNWVAFKDLLRRIGWSMIATSMMGSNQMEIPTNHAANMNILLWNCRGSLNLDFKRKVMEMAVNHFPSIMVIT